MRTLAVVVALLTLAGIAAGAAAPPPILDPAAARQRWLEKLKNNPPQGQDPEWAERLQKRLRQLQERNRPRLPKQFLWDSAAP